MKTPRIEPMTILSVAEWYVVAVVGGLALVALAVNVALTLGMML